jgi:hypothetical protein
MVSGSKNYQNFMNIEKDENFLNSEIASLQSRKKNERIENLVLWFSTYICLWIICFLFSSNTTIITIFTNNFICIVVLILFKCLFDFIKHMDVPDETEINF